jgi:hypothetical protein
VVSGAFEFERQVSGHSPGQPAALRHGPRRPPPPADPIDGRPVVPLRSCTDNELSVARISALWWS